MYNISQEDQAKVLDKLIALEDATTEFIQKCPSFPDGLELAKKCGKAHADLESELNTMLKLGLWINQVDSTKWNAPREQSQHEV